VVAGQDPVLEALTTRELHIAAVADTVFTDDDEDHVFSPLTEQLSRLHEYIKAADTLHAARHIGDYAHGIRHNSASDTARQAGLRPPQGRVDAVEDRADLGPIQGRKQAALPARGTVASVAVLQIQ